MHLFQKGLKLNSYESVYFASSNCLHAASILLYIEGYCNNLILQVALNGTDDVKREFCTGDCPPDIRDYFNDCSELIPEEFIPEELAEEIETLLEGK